jgi:opacity protein-like surface antigen
MTRTLKISIFIAAVVAASLFPSTDKLYAIGNFSLGANTGATYDPNYLENDINSFNREIENQKQTVPGTKGEQIDVPYSFVTGVNLKYQFNYILFRIGGQFTKTGAGVKGSFTPPAGIKNEIRISTYQAAFPLSIAFLLPVKERTYFYIGGGVTYYSAYIKITQSNPASGPFPTSGFRDRYSGNFPGWHFIIGAEVPVFSNYTISVEWMHQEGHSYPMTNDGLDSAGAATTSPKRVINAKGDFILFGVNYYISL